MADRRAEARLAVPVTARDHVRGPADAPVTLVEYGDFECPYCAAARPIVRELFERLGGRLRVVHRHFPLTHEHPRAQAAAEAAEAAAVQGKFWEMHDLLYASPTRLADADLRGHAAALGLDLGRFDAERATHAHAARVREDAAGGARSGVSGTPTFFVDGVRHDGPVDLRELLAAVAAALPEDDPAPTEGAPRLRIPRVVARRPRP
ncbi:MAG TPA: DsbA family protein [Chloroflexota bacterium]|jgi:protein-disulfide isomerase|nr:DsbA family protein [Chloroflexota bacterium]